MSCCEFLHAFFHGLAIHKDAILAFSALTAAALTAITIIIGLWTANRQLRATVISSNRLKWIADFREDVGGALSILASIHLPGTEPASRERQELLVKLQYHQAKIQLLTRSVHPVEGSVNILIKDAIKAAGHLLGTPLEKRDYTELDDLTAQIVQASRIAIEDEESRAARFV